MLQKYLLLFVVVSDAPVSRKNVRAKYVELGFEEVATAANANPALALFYRYS